MSGHPPGERAPGIWLASLKLPSSVHEEVGKSAASLGLRAPAGRFAARLFILAYALEKVNCARFLAKADDAGHS